MKNVIGLFLLLLFVGSGLAEEPPLTRTPEVTVTATRTPRSVESLTGKAVVLDREELDLSDAETLDEALAAWPGVDVVGRARYGQEVRVNTRGVTSGYGTQRTLVLLDGRPLTDEYLGNVDLAQYPLAAMRRVELVLGPASALYGTNALGGVVNLLPRRGADEPVTELSFLAGSFGTLRGTFAHGRKVGPVDLFVTLDGGDTDGYLRNSRGDEMDWGTRSGFLNVGFANDRLDVRAYLLAFRGEGTDTDFDRTVDRDLEDVAFRYDLDPEHDAVTTVRLYRSAVDQTLAWFERPEAGFDQSSLGGIAMQSFRVHPAHLVTGGIEWRLEKAKAEEAAGTVDEDARTASAFLQDEWDPTDDLRLVLGARYDDRTGIDGQISWRAGAHWQVADGTALRAAAGRAFRAPTLSDRYLPETSYFGMTFAGNPNLDPEVLYSAEAGVDQRILPGATASATVFATKAEDFWDFLPADGGILRPQNIARVDIYGVEILATADLGTLWAPLEHFTATVGYTYTDATYDRFVGRPEVEGNRIDDNVRHRGSFVLEWRHPDGYAARASLLASGDRFTDPENSGAGRLAGFYVLDVSAEIPLIEGVTGTLVAENVLNHGYRTRPEYPEPPRAILAGLRVVF